MAERNDLVSCLESLAKLDVDAVHAYTSAIERIDIPDVKQRLTAFRVDHERHISELSVFIERLGGTAPTRTPDLKGFLIQGFTAIRSMMGNEEAIKAMQSNEELTNKHYAEALTFELPDDIRIVVQKNRDDERRHLDYVKRCIDDRVWEGRTRTVA
ncbi:MAG: DUF2383 domain-containing protein [Deltaproteobacteria bacterium]|nr:DUF2383 domain-containing protein [Deltaproteobacteria bacterium]